MKTETERHRLLDRPLSLYLCTISSSLLTDDQPEQLRDVWNCGSCKAKGFTLHFVKFVQKYRTRAPNLARNRPVLACVQG